MTDEESQEEVQTPGEPGKGDNLSSTSKIKQANEAAERMEVANTKREELLAREEALQVERKLGGTAEAGAVPTPPKEETALEYKNRVMSNQ